MSRDQASTTPGDPVSKVPVQGQPILGGPGSEAVILGRGAPVQEQPTPGGASNHWMPSRGEPTVAEAGELASIAAFARLLPVAKARIVGPGDDCAVLTAPDGRVVVTADTMVEGPDFRTEWSTPFDVGWKLAASNLADVAAMGAKPTALIVSLVVPANTAVNALCELARGLAGACAELAPDCGVEGGDLATGPVIVAAATALGDLSGRDAVLRSGARPGDIVAVSGTLGAAARGLERLFQWAASDQAVQDAPPQELLNSVDVAAQLRPNPPISGGVLAASHGATAMLDVSDGLLLDAHRMAAASGVSLDLDSRELDEPLALTGGEDHALLATFPVSVVLPGGFRRIGTVTKTDGAPQVLVDGVARAAVGWDPFVGRSGARVGDSREVSGVQDSRV